MLQTSDVYLQKAIKRYTIEIRNEGLYVKDFIAPKDTVTEETGKIRYHGIEALTKQDRDPLVGDQGVPPERSYKLSTATYACEERALRTFVAQKTEAHAEPPLKPLRKGVQYLMDELKLRAEIRVRDLFQGLKSTSGRNTAIAAGKKWNTAAGEIVTDIKAAKRKVRQGCGRLPIYIVIPDHIMDAILDQAGVQQIIRDFKEVNLIAGQYPPIICGMRVLIPGALQQTANVGTITPPDTNATIGDIWAVNSSGTTVNDVYLVYANANPGPYGMNCASQLMYKDFGSDLIPDRMPGGIGGGRWVKVAHNQDEKFIKDAAAHVLKDVI